MTNEKRFGCFFYEYLFKWIDNLEEACNYWITDIEGDKIRGVWKFNNHQIWFAENESSPSRFIEQRINMRFMFTEEEKQLLMDKLGAIPAYDLAVRLKPGLKSHECKTYEEYKQ